MKKILSLSAISLVLCAVLIAGCSSNAPPTRELLPSSTSITGNIPYDLGIGEHAIISSPEGSLEVTVRAFNVTTGKILIEEKNVGTKDFQYDPKIWLQDGNGVNYTAMYCHADLCPGYVFFTTLPPGITEKRDLENLYASFRIPDRVHPSKLLLYWSNSGKEASWILIPGQ